MSETNKVILAAVLGILVGFAGGRLMERNAGFDSGLDEFNFEDTASTTEADLSEGASVGDLTNEEGDILPADSVIVEDITPKTETKTNTVTQPKNANPIAPQTPSTVLSGEKRKVSSTLNYVIGVGQKAGAVNNVIATSEMVAWACIHEDAGGVPGKIIGARRFGPGKQTVEVYLVKATEVGKKYFVTLRADDGDGAFDGKKDVSLYRLDGTLISDSYTAN